MAALSVAARRKIWKGLMRWWSSRGVTVSGILKTDLYNPTANTGAVAEADNWLDSAEGNPAPSTGYNNALSDPFKSNATVLMKAELLLIVAAVRTGIEGGLDDVGEYARRIVGMEVN